MGTGGFRVQFGRAETLARQGSPGAEYMRYRNSLRTKDIIDKKR